MLQLFRVRGIPVRADIGWVITFGLITWSLAAGYFPRMTPGASTAAWWAQALVAAALLFVSVFLHELSHALVATRQGIRVSGITLHIFGGVSELDSEPSTPRAEFLIAIVGPLTSVGVAALCFGVGRSTAPPAWATPMLGYLVVMNLLLALFNLVPGFPLDGGRILRAGLWWWRGRLGWATRVASHAGSAFGLALVALGMIRGFGGELLGGVWFILIGLVLHQGARSSYELVHVRGRLESVPVEDVMTRTPITVSADLRLAALVEERFGRHRVGAFPVERDGRLVGLVTWPDVERHAGVGDDALVAAAMVPVDDGLVVRPRDSAWRAFRQIAQNRVGRVLVVEDGRLVGIVSEADLRHTLAMEDVRARVARRAA